LYQNGRELALSLNASSGFKKAEVPMLIIITLALAGVGFVLYSVRRRHKAFPPYVD